MPVRLVTADSLGARPSPRSGRNLALANAPQAAPNSGAGLFAFGQTLQDQSNREETAAARAEFLKAKVEAENTIGGPEDEDWGTYEERLTKSLSEAKATAGARLSGGRKRLFESQADAAIAQSAGRIRDAARKRQTSDYMGWFETALADNMDAVSRSQDAATRTALFDSTADLIAHARKSGFIDGTGEARYRKFAQRIYADKRDAVAEESLSTVTDQSSNALIDRPFEFDARVADLDERVAASGLDTEKAAKARKNGIGRLAQSAVQGEILADPRAAQKALQSGKWDAYLGGNDKAVLLGRAQAEIGRRETEARAGAAAEAILMKDDITALATNGEMTTEALTTYERTLRTASKNQGAVTREVERLRRVNGAAIAVKGMEWNSPAENAALLDAQRPDPTKPGYAEQKLIYDSMAQADAKIRAARQNSPGDYAINRDPGLRQSWGAALAQPETIQATIARTVALQDQFNPGGRVDVLPESVAKQVVAAVQAMPNSAEQFDYLNRMYQGAGNVRFRAGILAALDKAGMTPEALVALRTVEGIGVPAASAVYAALSTKEPEKLPTADRERVMIEVRDTLEEWRAFNQARYQATGMQDSVVAQGDALKYAGKLATTYAAMGDGDAAKKAVAQLYGWRRTINDGPGGVVATLPKDGATYDDRTMRAGFEEIKRGTVERVAGAFAEVNPMLASQWRLAGPAATWVDAGPGQYMLMPKGTTAPLAGPDGRPLIVTADQVLAAGAASGSSDATAAAEAAENLRREVEAGRILTPDAGERWKKIFDLMLDTSPAAALAREAGKLPDRARALKDFITNIRPMTPEEEAQVDRLYPVLDGGRRK